MNSTRQNFRTEYPKIMPSATSAADELIGRSRELSLLLACHERARAGSGTLVLVSGEAGIGKTSLVRELASCVSGKDTLILTGACYDLSTTPPYGPWLEIARSYESSGSLPQLSNFLSGSLAHSELPSQDALFSRTLEYFEEIASQQPLMLALEDLHWADQSTLTLLRFIARHIASQPIFIVVTYRDDEVSREHPLFQVLPALVRESACQRIELRNLSPTDIRDIISLKYGLHGSESTKLVEYVAQRTEGNPLFVQETLRTLENDGTLHLEDDRWKVGDFSAASVPTLIHQMVEARLGRLSAPAVHVMQSAAVIGHQVRYAVLEHVANDAEIDAAIEEALNARLVEESVDRLGFTFRHALVREAIHETIGLGRRRTLHRMVADAYLQWADPDPNALAYHLRQAGDSRAGEWLIQAGLQAERRFAWHEAFERYNDAIQAMRYNPDDRELYAWLLLRAAELLRYANPARGIEYYEAAYNAGVACGLDEIAAHALFGIGQNQCNVGTPQAGLKAMQDAIATLSSSSMNSIRRVDPQLRSIDPAQARPVAFYRGTFAYWLVAFGRIREAQTIAEQSLDVDWRRAHDTRHFSMIASESAAGNRNAYLTLGHSLALSGHPEDSRLAFDLALEVNRGARWEPHNLLVANHALLGYHFPYRAHKPHERTRLAQIIDQWLRALEGMVTDPYLPGYEYLLFQEGRWDELREMIANNPEPTLFPHWSLAMYVRASLARYTGDMTRAWYLLSRLLPDGPSSEPQDHVHLSPGAAHRVAVGMALDVGDYDRARTWMNAHDRWLEWSGAVPGRAEGLLFWAQVHAAEGKLETANVLAEEALEQASEPEQPLVLIAIHRFLGTLATSHRAWSKAENHLRDSLEIADVSRLPFERALTLLSLAELYADSERYTAARRMLRDAKEICVRLGAHPTLERIDRLGASLGQKAAPEDSGLTAREIDVLELIVQGMTDRQIAERLFISHRTVMRHVSHILRKLDVDSRTAAATRAIRDRLV